MLTRFIRSHLGQVLYSGKNDTAIVTDFIRAIVTPSKIDKHFKNEWRVFVGC